MLDIYPKNRSRNDDIECRLTTRIFANWCIVWGAKVSGDLPLGNTQLAFPLESPEVVNRSTFTGFEYVSVSGSLADIYRLQFTEPETQARNSIDASKHKIEPPAALRTLSRVT